MLVVVSMMSSDVNECSVLSGVQVRAARPIDGSSSGNSRRSQRAGAAHSFR